MTRTGLLVAALVCCLVAVSDGSEQLRANRDGANCERYCDGLAERVLRACHEFGGNEDDCAEQARQARERCMNITCAPTSDCATECIQAAKKAFQECLADGGDPLACGQRARQLLHDCLKENCLPLDKCKRRCAAHAREVYRTCIELGGNEEECAARAREVYEECVEERCSEPPNCLVGCIERGWELFRECMATSNSVDPHRCIQMAVDFVIECIVNECNFPVNCENRCVNASARVYHLCRDLGGTKAGCATRACEFLSACLDRCPAICGGFAGIPCEEGEFCMFPPRECHIADNVGLCTPIPEVCPDTYEPVCGCDGITYANPCEAAAAAVSIDHAGECRENNQCGGIAGIPCEEGEFCKFAPGECHIADNMGVCMPIPEACPARWDPVCGCDGVTYANPCEAAAAAVSIDHHGECSQ